MTRNARTRPAPASTRERGAVLVMVAVWLPVLILFITLVVDVGNWFQHKRHLQLQADAGALAGGGAFKVPCSNAPIEAMARKYSGDLSVTDPYNVQVAPTAPENVHVLINSDTFWSHGGVDNVDGAPCTAKFLDVKITEADLPWFFGTDLVPAINAHARVSIMALSRSSGALPVGVPDVNPKFARAVFIDEDTGTEIASTPLVKTGAAGDLKIWDNSATPVTVPIATRVGVRIELRGGVNTLCTEILVECYDAESDVGLLYVRGWPTGGSGAQPNAPIARDVQLTAAECSDPYFIYVSEPCNVGILASVDFGGDPTSVGAGVTAIVDGNNVSLGYNASTGLWEGQAEVPDAEGPVPVELEWEETSGSQGGNNCTTTGGNKCKGTFGIVHRVFSGTDPRSGPIRVAQVWNYDDPASPTLLANSFPGGSSHALVVKIGLAGSLENATSVSSPLVYLRVTGSRNQSVDCDPAWPNLRDELANGCRPEYKINTGTACPATYTALQGTAQPWNCVAIQTGGAVGQVSQGMADRILGGASTCTSPSNWADFPNFNGDDPRIVPVFLTPFGSFSGSGNGVVPVTNFGAFYVTGWHGSPCVGDDPVPAHGYIVGRFIKHIFALNDGDSGTEFCDFSSFGACLVVLTD